ncbi:MAG TPA: lysine--tRNA ligase [Candidatus Paceibacterota bacterium]|nr:lysine--tRNA ligase [Candidatus Paceibacterota bacterium]
MANDEVRTERLKKLARLTAAGLSAYPATSKRSISIAEYLKDFDGYIENSKKETLVGRILSIRGQGGITFMDVFDGTARMQFVLEKNEIGEEQFNLFQEVIDQGDFIEAEGGAYLTKRGEKSLKITSWRMLSKSLTTLPDEWYGLQDPELKLRQRYIDLLLDEELRAVFIRRANFWHAIRSFLLKQGFLEVETPVLENSPGGADARPFVTHHNALDIDVYLRISAGELWQKRLLIAGFPKVFEIGRIFRNEGQSREHLQDYTQLETYEAYSDMHKGMEFIKDLYRHIAKEVYGKSTFSINGQNIDLAAEWDKIDFCNIIEERFGINPITCSEEEAIAAVHNNDIKVGETLNKARAVDHLWKAVRKTISGPAFLINVPAYLEPLAKRSADNPHVVERFQVILAGSEIGKGFSELNDPQDQRARFEEQQKLREQGDDEAQRLDEEYVEAMEYGMPPAFGFGLSERLFAFLEDRAARETQLFPLLRPKNKE